MGLVASSFHMILPLHTYLETLKAVHINLKTPVLQALL